MATTTILGHADWSGFMLSVAKVKDAHADTVRAAAMRDTARADAAADRADRAYWDAAYHARRIIAAASETSGTRDIARRELADAERAWQDAAAVARAIVPLRPTAARR